jgi:hypothetical protein
MLRDLAHMRCSHKVALGVCSRGYNPRRSREEIDYDGLLGEQAVGVLLASPIDTAIYDGGDPGYDITYHGKTIQVKLNTYPNGDLYFSSLDEFIADIAILVTPVKDDVYRIAGWVSRDEFMGMYQEKDYGYGTRYAVPQDKLKSILLFREEPHGKFSCG